MPDNGCCDPGFEIGIGTQDLSCEDCSLCQSGTSPQEWALYASGFSGTCDDLNGTFVLSCDNRGTEASCKGLFGTNCHLRDFCVWRTDEFHISTDPSSLWQIGITRVTDSSLGVPATEEEPKKILRVLGNNFDVTGISFQKVYDDEDDIDCSSSITVPVLFTGCLPHPAAVVIQGV